MRFYFTYGSNEYYPWQDGWTEIEAPNRDLATRIFMAIHPNPKHETYVNCAGIYSAAEFERTKMARDGNYGRFGHEEIIVEREVLD